MPPPLPLPFPFPLHIGTDICRTRRISRILRGRLGTRFIRRVLAPEELARARPIVHRVLEVAARNKAGRIAEAVHGLGRREDRARGDGSSVGKGPGDWPPATLQARGRRGIEASAGEGLPEDVGEEDEETVSMYKDAARYLAGRWV